jgi:hypothetical protein
LNFADHIAEEEKNRWIGFVMRFQQLTGPLMAKGFEDTTLYVYNRLLSLNEVGGDPDRFGISVSFMISIGGAEIDGPIHERPRLTTPTGRRRAGAHQRAPELLRNGKSSSRPGAESPI